MALPGVKTVIKDRFYSISRQDIPVGPKICLIARRSTADNFGNVRDLDVVQATTEQDVITAFGENSDAHRGYVELVAGGAERVSSYHFLATQHGTTPLVQLPVQALVEAFLMLVSKQQKQFSQTSSYLGAEVDTHMTTINRVLLLMLAQQEQLLVFMQTALQRQIALLLKSVQK